MPEEIIQAENKIHQIVKTTKRKGATKIHETTSQKNKKRKRITNTTTKKLK